MPQHNYRPRRSCLYMPAANKRALEKAKTLNADMIILDLEDAVAPESKLDARVAVVDAVSARGYGNREVVVRVNSPDSAWGEDDLSAAVASGPDGILTPKVSCSEDVVAVDEAMSKAGASPAMGLWIMMELPLAILNAGEIAARAAETRLTGMIVGTNDLAKEMNARYSPDRAAFQYALQKIVLAAKANGLIAIDGVFNDIKNEKGLLLECEQGRKYGYDGKTLIHPAQLNVTNKIFSPDEGEVEHARAVIAAFALPENSDKGVIKVNDKMTERLHLEQAEQLVAVDQAIQSM